jgi:hypothetical protein
VKRKSGAWKQHYVQGKKRNTIGSHNCQLRPALV